MRWMIFSISLRLVFLRPLRMEFTPAMCSLLPCLTVFMLSLLFLIFIIIDFIICGFSSSSLSVLLTFRSVMNLFSGLSTIDMGLNALGV